MGGFKRVFFLKKKEGGFALIPLFLGASDTLVLLYVHLCVFGAFMRFFAHLADTR